MKKFYRIYYLQQPHLLIEANGRKEAKEKALRGEEVKVEDSKFKLQKQYIVSIQEVK